MVVVAGFREWKLQQQHEQQKHSNVNNESSKISSNNMREAKVAEPSYTAAGQLKHS